MANTIDANGLPFRPVQGTEERIRSFNSGQAINGYVYFATDTKKIYCGKNNEFIPMGGNSGIYYANRPMSEDERYDEVGIFQFNISYIEGDQVPAADDLILNIPDGGFYRVLNVLQDEVEVQRIAISGGGGGTGPGGNFNQGNLSITLDSLQYDQTIVSKPYDIKYIIEATDSAGDPVYNEGIGTWTINNSTKVTETLYPGNNSFSINEYLDPSIEGYNIFSLTLSMNTGGEQNTIVNKKWYIKAVDLNLEWERTYSEANIITDEQFTLKWKPYGGVDCTTWVVFDDDPETMEAIEISAAQSGTDVLHTFKSLPYGVHNVKMYLSAEINGITEYSDTIQHELMFARNGSATLLAVPYYQKVATQYDTLQIPFMVYSPNSETCEVSFYINDAEDPISTETYDRTLHYWPYTLTTHGSVKLTISSSSASKDIELTVNKLDLDVSQAAGYDFSLRAIDLSSNNELKNWNQNGVTLDFSDNFDWINGGIQFDVLDTDGSVEKYIRVCQGTTMTVNYKPFASYNTDPQAGGKNIKFNFKATNCYKYDAQVLDCYKAEDKVGLKVDAQTAQLSSYNVPSFKTQYYENSYIELESEIWPRNSNVDVTKDDCYMMFWVDGVPAGVVAYPDGEIFTQGGDAKNIVIGSNDCDVLVYCLKVYNRRLSENEHLQNFIADAPSVNKMLDRYNRNDILDNNGEISYEKLVKNNPNCHVYMYEIPFMTSSKDDKDLDDLKHCKFTELYQNYNTLANPYYTADETSIYAQGTSSLSYGIAAFNLRSKFRKGLTDKNGNKVEKWAVSDNAHPIDLACTKVNVASCENCNNVVNQEWYNRFQPYHDAHRRKQSDKVYRDTMEFNSGVLFIKDLNQETKYTGDDGNPSAANYLKANVFADTKNYTKNPYYKQYSIANMGNDKKNIEVFHDVTNPRACCVEIKDNQNAEHWMTVYNENSFDKVSVGGKDVGPFYEFRYSVKDCKAEDKQGITQDTQKRDFLNFVKWMAESNPQAYTNAPLVDDEGDPITVTFGPYTFKGFDPPGYEGKENPTGTSLAGLTINTYAGTYTTDSYNYRMAKMLSECEEHLVMDSVVYHYLFISRHTMVDNVAKNTFWSTEDGQHWDLTKDYDNDTADGNDNSGFLTFTYGLEFGDTDAGGAGQIFNADQSVWINFIHPLYEAQKDLYKKLEAKKAWDPQLYLDECSKHQSPIPERCWIYDYFRKYIRPRRLGLDTGDFLNRLEGGKKTHQRAQFEKYHSFYSNSKYVAGTEFGESTAINLRLNKGLGIWNEDIVLPTSYYIDCYPSIYVGGQLHRSEERVKRGDPYSIPIGTLISGPGDGTCYIYGANMIQSIQNLSTVYPETASFSTASKLKTLEFGSPDPGYRNNQLESVNIASATMLQKVQIQNCGDRSSDKSLQKLELPNTKLLKDLRISGSTFTGLKLAKGCTVETLYLNDLGDLELSNLNKLTTVVFEDGDNNNIPDMYNKIFKASIVNTPAMDDHSYQFALSPSLKHYQFNDITWTITNSSDLTYENDKVSGIKALDNLKEQTALTSSTMSALSGTLIINVDCDVDEYSIYEKYSRIYPNLIIEYGQNVSDIDPAVKLIFKESEAEDAKIHYRVLGSGDPTGRSIGYLISANGPTGVAISTPSKDSTVSQVFEFTGYWIDKATSQKYYVEGSIPSEKIEEGAKSFDNIVPTVDMEFYPYYKEQVRPYVVKFYNWDAEIIKQENEQGDLLDSWTVPYGSKYDGPIKNFHYRPSDDLADATRWTFRGWSKYKYSSSNVSRPEYVDIENLTVTGNMVLYGHYVQENCNEVASKSEYFDVDRVSINGVSGFSIKIKDEYRQTLEGKITLPAQFEKNGVKDKVIQIGNFSDTKKITHVFCEKGSQYIAVGEAQSAAHNKGFSSSDGSSALKKVYLPNTVVIIGDGAFVNCLSLESVNIPDTVEYIGSYAFGTNGLATSQNMKVLVTSLPSHLKEIGGWAFTHGGENIKFSIIPEQITKIPSYCFSHCPNLQVEEIGTEESGKSVTYIDIGAFNNSGLNVTKLTLGSGIETINLQNITSSMPFYKFGKVGNDNLLTLKKDLSNYDNGAGEGISSIQAMGFSADWHGERG